MNVLQCPEEEKYLLKEKKYCIYDCTKELHYKYLYNGNYIESCPGGTTNVNNIINENPNKAYLGTNTLILEDNDYRLKVVQTSAKIYVSEFNYTEKHVSLYKNDKIGILFYEDPLALNDISLDIPKVDFQNCSKKKIY